MKGRWQELLPLCEGNSHGFSEWRQAHRREDRREHRRKGTADQSADHRRGGVADLVRRPRTVQVSRPTE